MRRRLFSICSICLVLASLAAAAQLNAAETEPTDSLADFDQSLTRFKRDIWNVQRLTSMFGRDFRGRTLSDDLRDFVLIQSTESALQKQRALVEKQLHGKRPVAPSEQGALAMLNRTIAAENSRLDEIFLHRLRYRQVARQRDLWREVAERAPSYKTPQSIERLEQEAVTQLNAGEFAKVTYRVYPALQRAYAAERADLAKYQRVNATSIYYSRRTPCGAPATNTTGKSQPQLVSKTHPEYPTESLKAGEEGNVLVDVLVATTGCATSYAIANSSGWPALDDAALDWIETTSFIPAERDGKATVASVLLPVNFKLEN
jgi:TonB family protein